MTEIISEDELNRRISAYEEEYDWFDDEYQECLLDKHFCCVREWEWGWGASLAWSEYCSLRWLRGDDQ